MNRFDLKKLQDFDSGEWSRFETEFFSRIYFYVKKQVKDHQAAEDIAQETFLGAVRGIGGFDTQYSYEQFLFGIARNRVVDYFRKKRPIPISEKEDSGMSRSYMGLERMASPRRAPDESAIAFEDMRVRETVLTDILRTFVGQLWEEGEFEKLKILEFLFALGGRNKEAAERFDVRDEKAVAGVKFRALERLRGLARQADPDHLLFEGLWKPGAR